MTTEQGVEDVERVEVPPAEGETVDEPDETGAAQPADAPSESDQPDNPEVPAKPETGQEPAPVPGETPREKALRMEVTRLRNKNRSSGKKSLIGETPAAAAATLNPQDEELLQRFNPDELKNFEALFGVYAKKFGYVQKSEYQADSYSGVANTLLDSFIESHPEYSPENDPDDALWNQFVEEAKQYRPPSNPRDYIKIFNKVHAGLFGVQPKANLSRVNAQQQKVKTAATGGGGKTSVTTSKAVPNLDPSARQHLKGFSEDELNELGL